MMVGGDGEKEKPMRDINGSLVEGIRRNMSIEDSRKRMKEMRAKRRSWRREGMRGRVSRKERAQTSQDLLDGARRRAERSTGFGAPVRARKRADSASNKEQRSRGLKSAGKAHLRNGVAEVGDAAGNE